MHNFDWKYVVYYMKLISVLNVACQFYAERNHVPSIMKPFIISAPFQRSKKSNQINKRKRSKRIKKIFSW